MYSSYLLPPKKRSSIRSWGLLLFVVLRIRILLGVFRRKFPLILPENWSTMSHQN
eukprot:UN01070